MNFMYTTAKPKLLTENYCPCVQKSWQLMDALILQKPTFLPCFDPTSNNSHARHWSAMTSTQLFPLAAATHMQSPSHFHRASVSCDLHLCINSKTAELISINIKLHHFFHLFHSFKISFSPLGIFNLISVFNPKSRSIPFFFNLHSSQSNG